MNEQEEKPVILVVDDVPANVDVLVASLRADYRVLIAINGRTALTIAQRTPHPDLILLDVMMPGMDGFEVCRQLKLDPETRDIPVIFVTAKDGETDEEMGLELGALDYIGKPFSVATVRARIRNHIRLAQQEKRLKQELLYHQEARKGLEVAYLVYTNTSEAVMLTDATNRIVAVNPAFCAMTGYREDEVIGQTPSLLSSGRHDATFFQTMWETLETTGSWQGEIWNRRKSGELYAEWLTLNRIYDEDGSASQHVALFSDITHKKKADEEIWRQANYDALTGLPNRHRFRDHLTQELKRAKRDNHPLALLYIDLDHFKEVNDTLGHDKGDLLLQEVACRLGGCMRESDIVARLGGDEFAAILPAVRDANSVDRVAQCLVSSLSAPFDLGERRAVVSASVGIALYPGDAQEMSGLLKNADQAMYAAKERGRNRYCYYIAPDSKL